MATTVDLTALLDSCADTVNAELDSMPTITDVADFDPQDGSQVPIEARNWLRVRDVVAMVADLKSSTQLGIGKHAASTASIYQAALQPVVEIFLQFGAGHIAVHGDCVIGLFWDDMAPERAMCAGITAKTFSERELVPRLEKKWNDEGKLPETGFKIGVAMSDLLVKRVGRARSPHWALVWPGKALNHATKAAQDADAHELIVTGSVWDAISKNEYLTFSCSCRGTPTDNLWKDHEISRLREDEPDRTGRLLTACWCPVHGADFCAAVLKGDTTRSEVTEALRARKQQWMSSSLARKNAQLRENRRNLRRARTGR
ncbi:MAG TPA: hypothetical protein VJM33_15255 [Microthrixaceae bacterium]|nr:hypothetical protein [Microthrixaceae bacterium]